MTLENTGLLTTEDKNRSYENIRVDVRGDFQLYQCACFCACACSCGFCIGKDSYSEENSSLIEKLIE